MSEEVRQKHAMGKIAAFPAAHSPVPSETPAADIAVALAPAKPSVHPSEEVLEEYCLNRINEPELGRIEEHLLLCPECCTRVADLDDYLAAMKAGLAEIGDASFDSSHPQAIPPTEFPVTPVPTGKWHPLARLSGNNFLKIAAIVVFAFSATIVWRSTHHSAPVAESEVSLIAMRGGSYSTPSVHAGAPFRLNINATTLAESAAYRLEVVDPSGTEMWSGTVPANPATLTARVEKHLSAGTYWVRLYASGDHGNELLREFGLRVE